MLRVLKLVVKVLILAPLFTLAVIVAILCGMIFDFERPRENSDPPER
jgi:hypothetical protein